jgi:hypothetical protein
MDTNDTGCDENYLKWIDDNEEVIITTYQESEECFDKVFQDLNLLDDEVDKVQDYIATHITALSDVPDDFIQKMYELSFENYNED